MSTLAKIWNLNDAAAWTAAGTDAKPRLEFSVSDPDGDSIASVILRIYTASAGGAADATYTLTGATLTAALAAGYYDTAYGMLNKDQASCERWWTIEATDSYGESSGESTRTAFKVCWGQAIYEYAVPGGASSSLWTHSGASITTGMDKAFLYRSAVSAGGGTPGAWKASMGDVTPNVYVNVLVRLSTYTASTNAPLPDMTFSSVGSAQQPDHWTASPSADWSLDTAKYRFGNKAFHARVDDNVSDYYIYPFRVVDGDDIVVQPNADYVFSAHVAANRDLIASVISLRVYEGGGLSTLLAQGVAGADAYDEGIGATSDPSNDSRAKEGWLRIHVHVRTGAGTTSLRPVVYYDNGGAGSGDEFWADATKLEEGLVVTPWYPGFLSPAVVLDSYGILLDGMGGATFRLRNVAGTKTVTLDQVVDVADAGPGGGAPTGADYLVGTTQAGLSAEIVVGTTPGGELGGTWGSPTVDATHSGSTHAAAQAAAEATAAAALAAHAGAADPHTVYVLEVAFGVGTSFPGSPATNDRYFRTDLGYEFFYNGTRWLTTQVFERSGMQSSLVPYSATTSNTPKVPLFPPTGFSDVWLLDCGVVAYIGSGTALSGSHKWVCTLVVNNGGTTIATLSFNSGASTTWRMVQGTIGALLGTDIEGEWTYTKTGTPGNITPSPYIRFRLVAT